MFLFKAYSYGAITEDEHSQSIELVENFVIKLDQAASSDQHIAFRYSKLLRNLLRREAASGKSQEGARIYRSQSQETSSTQVNPSAYMSAASAEGGATQPTPLDDAGSAMDLFQVSPVDTSSASGPALGNQLLWPFSTETAGAFYDFSFPAGGGEGPNNLDFLTF